MTKFVWMIPKFREDLSFKISPSYSLANKNFEVKLYCYLSSDVPFLVGCKHTIIHLYLHSYKKKQTAIWYRLSLLNASGDRCHSQEGNVNFVGGIRHGGLYQFERSYLLDEQNGFLVKGQLFIYFEMEEIINPLFMNHHDSLNTLSEDYRSLLNSSKLSDAILVAGTREFHVHKLILSSRSPVFEAMFGHSETKEAQDGRVEITDIDEQALELLIRFIYTGKIECIGVYALELLAAADKYQIECLKSICEQHLTSGLTVESVVDTFLAADLYRSVYLKSKCVEYIADHGKEVVQLDAWKRLNSARAEMAMQLFECIVKKM